MHDKSSQLDNSELKFAREESYFDRSWEIRFLICALLALSLFLFLHFREVVSERLELNTIAPRYIVAQVPFDFYDEEATIIRRQEALRNIGAIYRLSDKEIRRRRLELENFLIYHQDWQKYAENKSFDELHEGIDATEKLLLQLHFTDKRTLQELKEENLSTDNYLIYIPLESTEGNVLPKSVWNYVGQIALPISEYSTGVRNLIIGFFQGKAWVSEEDVAAERQLTKKVQASVPDVYTHVGAGSRIIDQGERVNTRHLAMLQAMYNAMRENRNMWHPLSLASSLIMAVLLTAITYAYFYSNQPQILASNRKFFLVVSILLLTILLAKITELFVLSSTSRIIEEIRYPVFVAFAAILIVNLVNTSVATFTCGFLALVLAMGLSFETEGFILINLAAALIAVLGAGSLRHRKEIFIVCFKGWLGTIPVIFSLHFAQHVAWDAHLLGDLVTTGMFLLITGVLVVGLLPLLETGFGVMTDVTLTEYLDPNNDVLRRLSVEAPGTYQHSIVVGNIAETAAMAIGANGLFCRVATLYHDIGKMTMPQYFTENQQSGVDIHQLLTPLESAEVIISHVSEGVTIGRRAGLPEQFIDIIKEHHGTTLVKYFYQKQLERMNGDKSLVDEKAFRYAGPKPRSKESAIIMIADTLEAASRSVEKINEAALDELATRLIRDKWEDRQFDDSLLTLEELATVKSTLVKTIVAFSHTRIKYPNEKQNQTRVVSAKAAWGHEG